MNVESKSYILALQNDDPSLLPSNLDGAMTPIKTHVNLGATSPYDASIGVAVLVFEELAKSRAVSSWRDENGASVLHNIFNEIPATGHHVNVLCKRMDPNTVQYPSLNRPLHYAAYHGNAFGKLEALLNQPGVDVNAQNKEGKTPAHVASEIGIRSQAANTILLLHKAGADLSIKDNDGRSAIDMLRGTKAAQNNDIAEIIAKHDKQHLIHGLGAAWKPSDCKEEQGVEQQQEERPRRQRKM